MVDLDKIYLFRMTHIDNVPHIMEYGITHISSTNYNSLYKSIGDSSIIKKRHSISLPSGKQLSEYIPFYFGARMPMLRNIQTGYYVPVIEPTNIVYFVTNVTHVLNHKLQFYFSDKHAVSKLANFYSIDSLKEIEKTLDFNAIKAKYWIKEDDMDFKSKKEAEFLIEPDIPYTTLGTFIVHDDAAKLKLESFGVAVDKIKVNKNYYF